MRLLNNYLERIDTYKKSFPNFIMGFPSFVMEDEITNDTAIAEFFFDKYKYEKGFQMINDSVVKHQFDFKKIVIAAGFK